MNAPIVNDAFQFVRCLYKKYLPVGFSDLQLDRGVELKNLCTTMGLRKGLDDSDMEILALAALLHNSGSIEGEFKNRRVSQAIAERFLKEKDYPIGDTFQVLNCIAATQPDTMPMTNLSRLIQAAEFSKRNRFSKNTKRGEVGDLESIKK